MAAKIDAQNALSISCLDGDADQKLSTQLLNILKNLTGSTQSAVVQPAKINKIEDSAKETIIKAEKNEQRKVLLVDTILGPNRNGMPNSRLLVPEECNPNQVKEYCKLKSMKGNIFRCVSCDNNKKYIIGNFEEPYFFAPINHHRKCRPISKIEAEQRLKLNERKKSSANSNAGIKESKMQITKSSCVTSHDSVVHKDNTELSQQIPIQLQSASLNVITVVEQNDKYINIDDHSMIPINEKENQRRKRLSDKILPTPIPLKKLKPVSNDAHINVEITSLFPTSACVQQNELGTSKSYEAYTFGYPSKKWLSTVCIKLNLIYHHNAYKLWGIIDIKEMKENSLPYYVQKVKDGKNSSFCALSFLVSGEENEEVKTVLQKYFYENFQSLGRIGENDFSVLTKESKIVKETVSAEEMTPILWETVAKYLECRVGIFEEGQLFKFGDWSNNFDDEIITLLFEKVNENYSIVTNLVDA